MFLRLNFRTTLAASLFILVSMVLLWYVHVNDCGSYLQTWCPPPPPLYSPNHPSLPVACIQ